MRFIATLLLLLALAAPALVGCTGGNPSEQMPAPAVPMATPNPALIESDPLIGELWRLTSKLEECAGKHDNPDYAAMAAEIRAALATISESSEGAERDLLIARVENAKATLAHC